MRRLLLVINPGSTSTKLALFEDEDCLVSDIVYHTPVELASYPRIHDQLPMRLAAVRGWLRSQLDLLALKDPEGRLVAIAARGGLLRPLPSGTYLVDREVLEDLHDPSTREHASNLGAMIAAELMEESGLPGYLVDPVSVDEMDDVARLSGLPELERHSLSHALSLKAAARRAAAELGRRYEELHLVVVHLGGGISVSAHRHGRMVDVNNANDQGPFSPERVGTLPLTGLLELCSSVSAATLRRRFWGGGGLVAHLGTNDGQEVERRIAEGDERALLVYRAMAYQVGKEIGAMAAVLGTAPDAIVLTGGLAHSQRFVDLVSERVSFLGRLLVYPGGEEMRALAAGTLRVLRGEEEAKRYGSVKRKVPDSGHQDRASG